MRFTKQYSIQRIADEMNMAYSTVRDHYYDSVKVLFSDFPDLF